MLHGPFWTRLKWLRTHVFFNLEKYLLSISQSPVRSKQQCSLNLSSYNLLEKTCVALTRLSYAVLGRCAFYKLVTRSSEVYDQYCHTTQLNKIEMLVCFRSFFYEKATYCVWTNRPRME